MIASSLSCCYECSKITKLLLNAKIQETFPETICPNFKNLPDDNNTQSWEFLGKIRTFQWVNLLNTGFRFGETPGTTSADFKRTTGYNLKIIFGFIQEIKASLKLENYPVDLNTLFFSYKLDSWFTNNYLWNVSQNRSFDNFL